MKVDGEQLGAILINESYISDKDFTQAAHEAKSHNIAIEQYLLDNQLLTPDLLGQAIAEYYNVPYVDLNSNVPTAEQVQRIPQSIASRLRIVLFQENENKVILTTDTPDNQLINNELKGLFEGKKIELAFSLSNDIDEAFVGYRQSLKTRFSDIIHNQKRIAPELLDEIFSDALSFRASDIHFEPQVNEVIVRFRIDGLLQEAGRLDKQYYGTLINRIKVQSQLRIDEHAVTQDGALQFEKNGNVTDMRVSVVPTVNGEKIVLRLLSHYVRMYTLNDLGLSAEDEKILQRVSEKPFGMIVVAGPTGSGKSTTLYAVLKKLNHPDVNVTTIEDPVEYKLEGANQIQVDEQVGLTFSKGLRSIVRQDPNIILVGEIRDTETVDISVNAALTGHLLLTTFHANDAATVIPRMLDMGVEPFLLASTLELIISQRLMRKICMNCKMSYQVKVVDLKTIFPFVSKIFKQRTITLYRGKGCAQCNSTGYAGRIGIFEMISVTQEIKDLILQRPSAKQIRSLADSQSKNNLFLDGLEKVNSGITTIEELVRVAPLSDDV